MEEWKMEDCGRRTPKVEHRTPNTERKEVHQVPEMNSLKGWMPFRPRLRMRRIKEVALTISNAGRADRDRGLSTSGTGPG
jgi:hypothetical protein